MNAIIDSTKYNKKSLVLAWGYFGAGKTHKLHQLKKFVETKNIGTCILSPIMIAPKNFGELIKSLFFDQNYKRINMSRTVNAIAHISIVIINGFLLPLHLTR